MSCSNHEKELIQRAQKNDPNDPYVMEELLILYRELLKDCIDKSEVTLAVDLGTAVAYASNFLEEIINKYNNSTIEPKKYIKLALIRKLKNLRRENKFDIVKVPKNLVVISDYVEVAKEWLSREGKENPKNQDIVEYIRCNYKKHFNVSDVEKCINLLNRFETTYTGIDLHTL